VRLQLDKRFFKNTPKFTTEKESSFGRLSRGWIAFPPLGITSCIPGGTAILTARSSLALPSEYFGQEMYAMFC
jgi:hypothetical protein